MNKVFPLIVLWLIFAPTMGQAACSLVQAPDMALGLYTGAQSDSGVTNLTVNCTAGSNNYTIGLSAGGSGNTANRTMNSGSTTLKYGLFRDSSRSQNWGNIAGTDTYSGNGSISSVDIPVYPRMAAGQIVAPGTYVDTITTASRSFSVTATVQAACTISAGPLAFGTYTGSQASATATLTVTCTNTTPYYINLGDGQNKDGSYYPRMVGPGGCLVSYRLYQNAAFTVEWRNTYNVDGRSGTGSGAAQPLTVYGRVVGGQYCTPGAYTDTVIATLVY